MCDRSATEHTTHYIDDIDMNQLCTKHDIKLSVDINIIMPSQLSQPVKVQWTRGQTDLATILNTLNGPYMQGRSPLTFEYLSMFHDEVVICNTCNEDVYVFLYAYDFIAKVPAGESAMVPVDRLINFGRPNFRSWREQPYVIVGDVPLLSIKATLQRKNGGGSYVKEEKLVIKPGVFSNADALVDHINNCITMRGERNGNIYRVSHESGILVVHATHRQPEGSLLEVSPLYPFAGINGEKTMTFPLRTKGKVELDSRCGHLFDVNIQNRRMY